MAARKLETGPATRIPSLLEGVLRVVPPTVDALRRWRANVAARL
jgi:hypothetical protein